MRRALILAAVAAFVAPAEAFAHARLEHTSPGFEQRLSSPPRTITLAIPESDVRRHVRPLNRGLPISA